MHEEAKKSKRANVSVGAKEDRRPEGCAPGNARRPWELP